MIKNSLKLFLTFLIVLTFQWESQASVQAQRDLNKWKKASQLIVANKTKKAERLLMELLRSKHLSQDLIYLTLARLNFQNKKFNKAMQNYKGVNQDSPYWIEAKEEMAWTYIRLNKPAKAIAQGATVLSPVFLGQTGPEPYFMMSYANLMICDYEKIFSISEKFKKNEAQKVEQLELLSSGKSTPHLNKTFAKLKKGPYHTSTIADELPLLPRDFLRDDLFKRYWVANNTSRAFHRVKDMARRELKEYRKIIHKLHLVEAEVIQRLHLRESKIGQRKDLNQPIVKNSDVMTFPETEEIWVDELDNYHLDAKDCPKIMQVNL